ncbi:MAG TPA: 5'-nucleotidase C-terminal domain-containing protein, partial [Gemmatimonadales bacterium]|nr:5'-nucleotidase C-terminal domain-containing protein [Gemmatimonadales bacterium]
AAALATALERGADECACPTVRVAPGGLLEGAAASDAATGRPAVEVLNRLGLAATALGARDAVWSLDTLRRRMAQSRFPWLAANLVDSASGRRPDWVVSHRVVDAGGLRVGLVGYVGGDAQAFFRSAGVTGIVVRPGAAALREALGAVKREGADLAVVLAHAAVTCGAGDCAGEPVELARELAGAADVIVAAGDSGAVVRVGPVQVVAARPGGAEVATVDLVRTVVEARELRVSRTPVDPDRLPPDSAVAAIVDRATARADSLGRRVVARVKLPLRRGARGDSPLGDLVADAQRNALRADVAVVSDATLAGDLPAGPVTQGELRALHGGARALTTLTVTGGVLRQVLEAALSDDRPVLHVSGVLLRYDPRAPAGRRVRRVRLSDGSDLKDKRSYTLALAAPLARSARLPMLGGAPAAPSTATDTDALAAYLQRLPQPVAPPEPGRLQAAR